MKTLLIGINSKYIHPAMGVFQIYTNSNTPCSYKEFTIKDNIETILNFIKNETFDILGFSVYIWNINFIHAIISRLGHLDTIILGGPEASYRPEDFLKYKNVYYIIKDEGEEAFNHLITELNTSKNFNNVPNLYFKVDYKFQFTYSKNPNIKNIKYDYSLIKDFKNRVVYLEASRGCCFKCSYCLASLEKGIRYLDLELVLSNIKYALANGARVIKFLDRSFNIKQELMRKIIEFIIDNDNNYSSYQFEIVGDKLDKQTIDLLKTVRKGLIRFEIGIQSLNPKTTRAVNRRQNLDILIKNIKEIKDNIVLHLDLIAGLPYENLDSFKSTFNETFKLFADELQLGFLKELKGTFISLTKDIHEYNFSPNPPYEIIDNKYISQIDLEIIRFVEAALNKFYNSSNFKRTMDYLFNKLNLDPYDTFLLITKHIGINNLNKYQFDVITNLLYQALADIVDDKEYFLSLIKQDYLLKFCNRPKLFWKQTITREERNEVYKKFIQKYEFLSIEDLYRYAQLEKYNSKYFLITYKPTKKLLFL